jgi:hypothetical protein
MTHGNSELTCEQFADGLGDLLERDLGESARTHLEGHALACAECGALLADLRKMRMDAANLPALEPSRDLWSGIAARIETPVVEIMPGRGAVERWSGGAVERSSGGTAAQGRRVAPMWMGLAAAGLVAITAGVTYQLTKSTIDVRSPSSVASTVPTAAATTAAAATPVTPAQLDSTVQPLNRSTVPPVLQTVSRPSAEQTYDLEIRRLNAILVARRAQLDTTTIAVVEKNLRIIDDAIAQCKAALKRDPASRFLIESLNDALDTKVQLLRTAAQLSARS